MNVTQKLAILSTLFLTLGIAAASAAHTPSVDVTPSEVQGDSTTSYTVAVENQQDSSDDIYKIRINPDSAIGIEPTSVTCPDGWTKDSSTDSDKAICYTDAFSNQVIEPGSTDNVKFDASNPADVEQSYDWTVETTDNNQGNRESSTSQVLVDDVAPDTNTDGTTGGDTWRTTTPWTVEFTASDDGGSGVAETYYCKASSSGDCDPESDGGTGESVDVSSEGTTFVRYFSEDDVGNQESINEGKVKIDTGAPQTTDDVEDKWYDSKVEVELDPSDDTSGVDQTYYCVADTSGGCDPQTDGLTGTSPEVSAEGTSFLRYQSKDVAGNTEEVKETQVRIDTTKPTLTVDDGNFNIGTGDQEAIKATVTDNLALSAVEIELDTDNDGNYESTAEMDSDGSDTYQYNYNAPQNSVEPENYRVVARDEAGNEEASSQYTITVEDDEAPSITDQTGGPATTGDQFTFDADITDNIDVTSAQLKWKYDGEQSYTTADFNDFSDTDYSHQITVEDTQEDILYRFTASDAAGNTADTGETTIDVEDNDAPTAKLSDLTVDEDTTATLDASASSDNIGIVEYRWDFKKGDSTETDEETTSDTADYKYNDPGDYKAEVTVEDAAGNTDSATATVTVQDTTPPNVETIEVQEQDSIYSNFQTINLEIDSTDNEGVETVVADFSALESMFRLTDVNEDDEQDMTAEWSNQYAASGEKSVHITSGGDSTKDYAKLVIPTQFQMETNFEISYQGLYKAESDTDVPDETFLFLKDGTVLANSDNNNQCSQDPENWCTWSFSDASNWYKVTDEGTSVVNLDDYASREVMGVGFGAGSPTSQDGVVTDVYLDDFEIPGVGTVDEESDVTDLYDVPATDSDEDGFYESSYTLVNGPEYDTRDIEVRSTDAAGNTGTSTKQVTVDNDAPHISEQELILEDVKDGDGYVSDGQEIRIQGEVEDDSSIKKVEADASAFGAGTVQLQPTELEGQTVYESTVEVDGSQAAEDGSHAVTVYATDVAENTGEEVTGTLTLDTTKPDVTGASISVVNSNDGLVTDGDQVEVSTTVTDENLDKDKIKTDASAFGAGTVYLSDSSRDDVYEATFNVGSESTASDGEHSLTVDATDKALNTGSDTTGVLEVDVESPTDLTVDSPSNKKYKQTTQTLDVTYYYSEDNPESETVTLKDGSSSATYTFAETGYSGDGTGKTRTLDLDSPDEGSLSAGSTYDIDVQVTDQTGQTASTTATDKLVLDEDAPDVSITDYTGKDSGYVGLEDLNNVWIAGSSSDENGLSKIKRVADGPGGTKSISDQNPDNGEFNYSFDLSSWSSGQLTLEVEATDLAENPATESRTVTIDADRPEGPNSVSADDIYSGNQGSYGVDVTLVDGHEEGTVYVRLSDGSATTDDVIAEKEVGSDVSQPVEVTVGDVSSLKDGDVTVEAKFTDKAGNDNENGYSAASETVVKDTEAPDVVDAETTGREEITIDFDEDIDGASLDPTDLAVSPYGIEDGESSVNEPEDSLVTIVTDQRMPTDATPTVTINPKGVEGNLKDNQGNKVAEDTEVVVDDGLNPQIESVTTYDVEDGVAEGETEAGEEGDGTVNGVKIRFSEDLNFDSDTSFPSDAYSFPSDAYNADEVPVPESGSRVVKVPLAEEVEGTSATPRLRIADEAVSDDSNNPFLGPVTVRSSDGAAPVLMSSEVNQDESDSDRTVLDLRFSEFVKASPDASATLSPAEGTLQFSEQTGTTLQATYHDSDVPAVLNTGEVYEETEGEETEMKEPEVEAFTGVNDVARYRDAGKEAVGSQYTDGDEDVEVSSETALHDAVHNSENKVIQLTEDLQLTSDLRPSEDTVIFGEKELDLNGYHIVVDRSNANTVDSDLDVALEGVSVINDKITNNKQLVADVQVRRLGSKINSVDLTLRNNHFTTPNKVVSTYRQGIGTGDLVFVGNDVDVEQSSDWRPALHLDKLQNRVEISDNDFNVQASDSEAVYFGNSIEQATVSNNHFTGVRAIKFSHSTGSGASFNIDVKHNVFDALEEAVFVEGMEQYDETNGDLSDISLSRNRFVKNTVDIDNDHSEDEVLSATDNWFGMDNVVLDGSEGDVDASYSTLNSAVNSQGTDIRTFTMTLEEGSNMVSFPIRQGRKPVSEVIEDGSEEDGLSDSNVDTVWTYQNGQWRELATGYGDSEEDYFRGGLGYIFHMTDSDTLSVNVNHEYQQEEDSTPESLELSSTWNLVGSYQEFDQSADDALSSLDSDYKAFNDELNCVEDMETGVGYWVTRTDNNGLTPSCS